MSFSYNKKKLCDCFLIYGDCTDFSVEENRNKSTRSLHQTGIVNKAVQLWIFSYFLRFCGYFLIYLEVLWIFSHILRFCGYFRISWGFVNIFLYLEVLWIFPCFLRFCGYFLISWGFVDISFILEVLWIFSFLFLEVLWIFFYF